MKFVKRNWNVDRLVDKMEQSMKNAVDGGLKVMQEEAATMRDLARSFAPHLHGHLEHAIRWRTSRTKKGVEVYVDLNAAAEDDKTVGDYAIRMHEQLSPFGSGRYRLGPVSRAKDGGRGVVGGKFLDRAITARIGVLGRKMAARMRV